MCCEKFVKKTKNTGNFFNVYVNFHQKYMYSYFVSILKSFKEKAITLSSFHF